MVAMLKGRFVLVLLITITIVSEQAFTQVVTVQPESIWFSNTKNFGKRFLYSQAILWPCSITGHLGLYLLKEDFDWQQAIRWDIYKRTFTEPPKLDSDHWSWNYEVHPLMGSVSYLSYRNRQASIFESVAGSALNSVIYEYLIAGGTQRPSWNDMLVTTTLGSLAGEGFYQLKKWMIKDKYLHWFEKVILTITDPVEVFYYGFNFNKIITSPYR